MTRTIILFGRRVGVQACSDEATLMINWSEANNFRDLAAFMISGDFGNAIVMPVNSTHGGDKGTAVRVTVDHEVTNFRGFTARFWLGDKPYSKQYHEGELPAFDFDWVAFIPCAESLV